MVCLKYLCCRKEIKMSFKYFKRKATFFLFVGLQWRIHRGAPPPNGSQFFHFRIRFRQKVPTSEVAPPPTTNGKSWIRSWITLHSGEFGSAAMREN